MYIKIFDSEGKQKVDLANNPVVMHGIDAENLLKYGNHKPVYKEMVVGESKHVLLVELHEKSEADYIADLEKKKANIELQQKELEKAQAEITEAKKNRNKK